MIYENCIIIMTLKYCGQINIIRDLTIYVFSHFPKKEAILVKNIKLVSIFII